MYSLGDEYPESPGESEESITEEPIDSESSFRQAERSSNARGFPARRETERQLKWAVKTFNSWCVTEGVTQSLDDILPSQLSNLLKKFYRDARRKDGCDFSKAGLTNIRNSLDRYVKSKLNYSILKTSVEFNEANKVFDDKIKQIEMSVSSPWRQSISISPQDMKILLQSGVIGGSSPVQLLNSCWFNILLHFDVGDHLKQRRLSKQQFVIRIDESGREIVKMIAASGNTTSPTTMQSVPGHPLCPVALLKKYLSKLHPDFDALFQCPVRHQIDDSIPVWYEKQAIGVHALEGKMTSISKNAGLSRIYSNSSLGKSSSLVYMQCGFGVNSSCVSSQSLATGNQCTTTKTESSSSLSLASAATSYTQSSSSQGFKVSDIRSVSLPTSQSYISQEQRAHPQVQESEPLRSPSSANSTSSFHSESGFSSFDNQSPMNLRSPGIKSCIGHLQTQNSTEFSQFGSRPHADHGHPFSHDVSVPSMSGQSRTAIGVCMPTIKVESGSSVTACERMAVQPSFPGESIDLPSLSETFEVRRETASGRTITSQQINEPPPDLQSRTYLHLEILGGRSFMDFEGNAVIDGSLLTMHLHFRGQRRKSKPVPCCSDPQINEEFYFEVFNSHTTDPNSLLAITDAVHFILSKSESGASSLIGSHYFDWQAVLKEPSGQLSCNADVYGLGEETKLLIGTLQIRLEVLPHPCRTIPSHVLDSQTAKVLNRDRQFMAYARRWWKEYMAVSPTHSRSQVKIFAQDECDTSRPVVSFPRPLQAGWLLDNPRHAARFVSLLPHEEDCSMFGGRVDRWSRLHVILCRGKGSTTDHSLLLCSLLLGFGLEAYVCLGTQESGQPHVWVMTRRHDGTFIFWESLTGQRLELNDDASRAAVCLQYRTVGCVFSNTAFYANIQTSGLISNCEWDFSNPANWKAMHTDAIASICGSSLEPPLPLPPSLLSSAIDVPRVSRTFEEEMKSLIHDHRQALGLPTDWDDIFSHSLSPCLAAHETEARSGLVENMEELRGPITRSLRDTLSLTSVTLSFNRLKVLQAFAEIKRSRDCQSVIGCQFDGVTYGLRVKVFPYPDGACAVWLIVALKFPTIDGEVTQEWRVIPPNPVPS